MIAMIDDSKLGDRAICFESIGFNVAAGQASSPRASSFTSFAVPRTKVVLAPGFPQLPESESCRSSPIPPNCQSHSHVVSFFGAYPCQSHHCPCDLDRDKARE